MPKTNPSLRSLSLALAATAGLALPAATALASRGADDPVGTTTTTTTTTTGATGATGTTGPIAGSARARAIAVAKARVGGETTVVRVRRKNGSKVAWEVRLSDGTFRWTVREDRRFRVVKVQRERIRAAAGTTTSTGTTTTPAPATPRSGDDDGTADQGRGDAPGTAGSSGDDDGGRGRGGDD